jgi:hypothetical protein
VNPWVGRARCPAPRQAGRPPLRTHGSWEKRRQETIGPRRWQLSHRPSARVSPHLLRRLRADAVRCRRHAASRTSESNRGLPMNLPSVAAGVPPAVEGGVSPPGSPGSWSVSSSVSNRGLLMNLPMQAIARVEPGSLTPTLSRRERVSRPALGDMPEPRPSEPSRLALANAWLNPANLAEHSPLLPPGEGRDEGRSLHASRPGSGSPFVSKSLENAPAHEP